MTDTLVLPVNGKDYTIPSPPAKIGLALQASYVIATARRRGSEVPGYALARAARYDKLDGSMDEDALGPAWEQMIEDDVPLSELRRAAQAAYVWIVTGSEDSARLIMDPETPQTGGGSGPKASTTTDEAATTPTPDSTSGMTSRPEKSSV